MYLFTLLTSLLPARLQPAAKAITPAIIAAGAVVGEWVKTGSLDSAELLTALIGGVTALFVYFVPNARPTDTTKHLDTDAAAVRQSIADGKTSTQTGLREMSSLTRQALGHYGITAK